MAKENKEKYWPFKSRDVILSTGLLFSLPSALAHHAEAVAILG